MKDTNKDKSRHGASTKTALADLLQSCKGNCYVSDVVCEYRAGYPNYSNDQFYAPYLITLPNGAKWILYTTTSMRTDRIKGNQWDVYNLKRIIPEIEFAALVYPDGLDESIVREFDRQRDKYVSGKEYSVIDDIISQRKLFHLIESAALSDTEQGSRKDREGKSFEKTLVSIINNPQNFIKWKEDDDTIVGLHYDIFSYIVCNLNIDKQIISIEATAEIPKLPTGGMPKTDVLIKTMQSDGTYANYTLSCKRSSAKSVSVHQYTADAFADVLDPNNNQLRQSLQLFQDHPSLSEYGENNAQLLTTLLAPYNKALTMWVLGGQGGAGDPTTQWADYIIMLDNNTSRIKMYSTSNYCDHLISNVSNGHFGTVFSWTYASKQRGKSIQLKCKLL